MPLTNVHAVNLFFQCQGNPARKSSRNLSDLGKLSVVRDPIHPSSRQCAYLITVEQIYNLNSDLLRVRPWDNCTSSTFDQVTNNL